eukprot:12953057-Alexandrium_andersonii.AAC.1
MAGGCAAVGAPAENLGGRRLRRLRRDSVDAEGDCEPGDGTGGHRPGRLQPPLARSARGPMATFDGGARAVGTGR